MKRLLFLPFLFLALQAHADQCQALELEMAEAAVKYFETNRDVVLWCACCDDDTKQYVRLDRTYHKWTGDWYELVIVGHDADGFDIEQGVDLAYIHAIRSGKAYCAGVELGCGADPCTKPFNFKVPAVQERGTQYHELGPFQLGTPPAPRNVQYNFPDPTAPTMEITAGERWITCLGFSPDGTRLIAGGGYFEDQSELYILDVASGNKLHTLKDHKTALTALAVSPIGNLFVTAAQDGALMVWDHSTGFRKFKVETHTDWVEGLAFSADGKYFVSASRDKRVIVWDAATATAVREFRAPMEITSSVAFSPDNHYLAIGGIHPSKEMMVVDILTGKEVFRTDLHSRWCKDLAYAPDGQSILSAGECDYNAAVLDATTGTVITRLESDWGCVEAVDIDPSGRYIAMAALWGIGVFELQTGSLVFSARTHAFPVEDVVFSPDGKYLASCARGGEIHLWDLRK